MEKGGAEELRAVSKAAGSSRVGRESAGLTPTLSPKSKRASAQSPVLVGVGPGPAAFLPNLKSLVSPA